MVGSICETTRQQDNEIKVERDEERLASMLSKDSPARLI